MHFTKHKCMHLPLENFQQEGGYSLYSLMLLHRILCIHQKGMLQYASEYLEMFSKMKTV